MTYLPPAQLRIGPLHYEIVHDGLSIVARRVSAEHVRRWSLFAGGSAGVSGSVGSIGFGPSVAMAKLSVKGTGGIGVTVELDHTGKKYLERRMEGGVAVGVQIPSVNTGIKTDAIDVSVVRGEIMTKGLFGQRYSFTDLDISEQERRMTEAGFLLEAFSLGGAELTPIGGPILRALSSTVTSLAGVDHFFRDGLIREYYGLGVEGELAAGLSIGAGPLQLKAFERGGAFALSKRSYSFPPAPRVGASLPAQLRSNPAAADIRSAIGITLAHAYAFSALNFGFKLGDHVELSSRNFSLFDEAGGSEASYFAAFDSEQRLKQFSFSLTGGGELAIFGPLRSTYFRTTTDIPVSYAGAISAAGVGPAALVTPGSVLPIGGSLVEQSADLMRVLDDAIDEEPIRIATYETRGVGYELDIGVELDGALGVGVGLLFGISMSLFDEVEFPRKEAEVYRGGMNYLVRSSEYAQSMEEASLSDIIGETLAGILPLLGTAIANLIESIEELVESGKEFLVQAARRGSELVVGTVHGVAQQAGKWIVSTFSPRTRQATQNAFELPEVREQYVSHRVVRQVFGKTGDTTHVSAGTKVVIISESMNVAFIPDGHTEPVTELGEPTDITMTIHESDLIENDFSAEDRERVRIYYFDENTRSWVRKESILDGDVLTTSIHRLGTYALGVEINLEADETPPEIYEIGPPEGASIEKYPEVFGRMRDDRYGSGFDVSRSFIILNGDTLDASYSPAEEKLFYQLSEEDGIQPGPVNVEIVATDFAGNRARRTFAFSLTATSAQHGEYPEAFRLEQNYPNPFSSQTTIPFMLPVASHVELHVYDVLGRYVATLYSGELPAGPNEVVWRGTSNDGSPVGTGTYFYQIKAGDTNVVRKMMIVR